MQDDGRRKGLGRAVQEEGCFMLDNRNAFLENSLKKVREENFVIVQAFVLKTFSNSSFFKSSF